MIIHITLSSYYYISFVNASFVFTRRLSIMKFFFQRHRPCLIATVIAALAVSVNASPTGNPLATSDQQTLNALAIKINQDDNFTLLKAKGKAAKKTTHGLSIRDKAASNRRTSL